MLKLKISTGKFKNTNLCVPTNSEPVKNVVKQSAFSFIGEQILNNANILDLYCGSGQLGFEALSNNANVVTFVDEDYNSKECVQKTLIKLNIQNCNFIHKDALKVIGESNTKYSLVFADPPYSYKHKHLLKTVHYVLQKNGIFVFFHSSKITNEDLAAEELKLLETRIFGNSAYSVYVLN